LTAAKSAARLALKILLNQGGIGAERDSGFDAATFAVDAAFSLEESNFTRALCVQPQTT
jgi:hypothetical protein